MILNLRFLRLLPLLALAVTAAVQAATATLNLKDADINTLIAMVSEITGKNFIVDARVKGKVTVISARPMTPGGVYETFLGVLQVNGFAAIPDGQAIKIVPETNARTDGGTLTNDGKGLPIDEVVTHVYTLENVSAAQLVPILRPLVPQWGHLAAYTPSNQLIISDRAANVQRIEKLIKQMDQSGDREIEVVKLQNAAASEVVRILTTLVQQDKTQDPSARPAVVIADERSNSMLIGGDKAERQKLLEIIQRLDQPLKDDGATQVIYLRYASAENLAPILQGYAQQASKPGSPGGIASPVPATGGGSDAVHVLADKDTNALIITAPPKTMRQVRDVIAQLDIQRSQVLVEAVIAEVSANKSSQLGIDWAVFNRGKIAAASIPDSGLASAAAGLARGGVTGAAALGMLQGVIAGAGHDGGETGTSFAVLIKALQGDGDSNVLSTPTLVTLDNQEAKFSAGQEVPFLTGQFSNTAGGTAVGGGVVNPFQTIERKDVGLTLGVTPQINAGNAIKLKLDLEVSGISSGTAGSASLITNKRKLTNTVGVEDGQVLVIGGLIDDQLNDQATGVPFISKIPLIGSLFSSRSVTKIKRNLMVFIKPTILRKQTDGDYYTRKKYDAVRQAQIEAGPGAVPLIGGERPVLKPLEQYSNESPPKPAAPATAAVSKMPGATGTGPAPAEAQPPTPAPESSVKSPASPDEYPPPLAAPALPEESPAPAKPESL